MINYGHDQEVFIGRLLNNGATPENQIALTMVDSDQLGGAAQRTLLAIKTAFAQTGDFSISEVIPLIEDVIDAQFAMRVRRDWGTGSALHTANRIKTIQKLNMAISECSSIAESILQERSLAEASRRFERVHTELTSSNEMSMPVLASDVLPDFIKDVEDRHEGVKQTGLSTGIDAVDQHIGNIDVTDLIVIAGAPGWGKTEFGLKCLTSTAQTHSRPVLIFTIEMNRIQITRRIVAIEGDLPAWKIKDPRSFSDHDWSGLAAGTGKVQDSQIYIDDSPEISVMEIVSKVKLWKAKHPDLAGVMIDYIQNVDMPESMSRSQEINKASKKFKSLAKEIGCPVWLISQINRDWYKRGRKEPGNQDLAEGSGLERDASIIMIPYRETEAGETNPVKDLAKILVTKNRENEKKDFVMEWTEGHFKETSREWPEDEPVTKTQKASNLANRLK